MRSNGRNVLRDAATGALAGAVATWAMGRATTWLYDKEDDVAREREEAAREGKDAYTTAAEKSARLMGRRLDDERAQSLGQAIHWATGVGAGAVYGLLRRRVPNADLAQGTAFGAAFFLLIDEGMNPLLGFTPGPRSFPWQSHARGLAGHLVFGAVAESILKITDRAA